VGEREAKTHPFYAMSLDTGTTSPETRLDERSHPRELDEAVISARRAHEFGLYPIPFNPNPSIILQTCLGSGSNKEAENIHSG